MKKRKIGDRGFTLVEMILAVALISIFFSVVVVVFNRTIESYATVKQVTGAINTADALLSGMTRELEFATNIRFEADGMKYSVDHAMSTIPMDGSAVVNQVENGVYVLGKPKIFNVVFDSNFYRGQSVEMSIEKTGDHLLYIRIKVMDENSGELLYTEGKTIYLYNQN